MKSKTIKIISISALCIVLLSGLVYSQRDMLIASFVDSRTHEYLDRCDNSKVLTKEAKIYISPTIDLWMNGTLTKSEKKIVGQIWIDLKNNAPSQIGGSPLSDKELSSRIAQVKEIVAKYNENKSE